MSAPRTTADIMATQVFHCTDKDSLATAHRMMSEHQIRHMPVIDSETGEYLGLVTQKEVLRHAFTIAGTKGIAALESAQAGIPIVDVMSSDTETVQPQLPLLEAGRYFLESKHGCLPVLVDGKLVGIITSADFVKLSVTLLEQQANR
ncbi:MAG: CBS domain-containing protein [Gammaproteobacteria bacterium]